ncbi:MAG: hypothetical protein IT382_15595 [Deltaproteobacteria bacterium]|nr:hypothetical protein [Deltaproteobacteria bacterium]
MVGVRALGMMCNDPQRGVVALHELAGLAELPGEADALGTAAIVDGAALLSRLPSLVAQKSLADTIGPIQGRCAVVQVRVRDELRPTGPAGNHSQGPFRARSYAAAVIGGPQDADGASASREQLLHGVPDFLRRFVGGHAEGEALFLAILARLHALGGLESPHDNGAKLAQATREVVQSAGGARRHVTLTNGVEIVHVSVGMPSAVVTLGALSEATANRVDPTLADSSMGRERLRRFRGVVALGGLDAPLKASTSVPDKATLQVMADSAAVLVARDLSVRIL